MRSPHRSRHYERDEADVRLRELRGRGPGKGDSVESPYDVDARYRQKGATGWTGYTRPPRRGGVHLTETCDDDAPRLVIHADTTAADVHEAKRTAAIHDALAAKGLAPSEHLVDSAYVSAGLLVASQQQHGIRLVGPPRKDARWQSKTEGGYTADRFVLDWDRRVATCPQGKASMSWTAYDGPAGPYARVQFAKADCATCPAKPLCARSKTGGRSLRLHPRPEHEALEAMRAELETDAGRQLYGLRSGIESTMGQGVRSMGMRQTRYRGLDKTRLGHVATAAALSVDRAAAWLSGRVVAPTRTSRFAALAA